MDEVIKAAIRAKELVKHILTFSRKSEQEKSTLFIHLVVKEALKLLRASIPTTIEIKQNIDSKCGAIYGDPTQIHQVLMNLSTNAAHALEESGGVIKVTLEKAHFASDYMAGETQLPAGSYVKLTVNDNGPGIDPNLHNRIFEPYFTTKEVGKGSGLGLAVVHGSVIAHNGAIDFESTPGQGTSIYIYFPAVEGEADISVEQAEPMPTGKERILLVDDEEAVINIGKKILERLGYTIISTTDSKEALAFFRNQPADFDLVITDQTMPKMTGVELSKELLQIRPDIPIILCTGYSSLVDEEKAKVIGIKHFTLKPFKTKDLAYTVRTLLDANQASE